MGRKTYESAKPKIKLTPGKHRLVMTRHPQQYQTEMITGQLEFTNEPPTQLIKRLKSIGHKKCLVVGGSEVAFAFLKAKLINKLLLTIEPYLFGLGKQYLPSKKINIQLKLVQTKLLNKNGSLLLHYKVI